MGYDGGLEMPKLPWPYSPKNIRCARVRADLSLPQASTNDSEPLIARTVQGFFEKNVAVSLKICDKAEEEPKAEVAAAEEPKAAEEAKDEEKPKEEAKEEEKPKEEEDKPKWKKKRSQPRQWLKFPEFF
ncbi:hypothetical protein GBA52_020674 [Prunus armeniaca]|nr:hypothetical protein GBA52_020674 [Prunus armeniaca]